MACIARYGRGIAGHFCEQKVWKGADDEIGHARSTDEYKIQNVKSFDIFCERKEGLCIARLFMEGDARVIETGRGINHLEAIHELMKEVGPWSRQRERERSHDGHKG